MYFSALLNRGAFDCCGRSVADEIARAEAMAKVCSENIFLRRQEYEYM